MGVDPVTAQGSEAAGDLAQRVGVVEDRTEPAVVAGHALEGRLPVSEGGDVDLTRAQHLLELRAGEDDEVGGVLREPVLVQGPPHRVVEMGAQRADGDGLAGNVGDALDRAVVEHVEDRLDLLVDAVRGVGAGAWPRRPYNG